MTAKEKAKEKAHELVVKYSDKASECSEETEFDYDKQCALICVDEKIASVIRIKHPMNTNRMNRRVDRIVIELEEIKKEIKKL